MPVPKSPKYPHPYQQRVYDEFNELNTRKAVLRDFMQLPTYLSQHRVDQDLMAAQLGHMSALAGVLERRLTRFEALNADEQYQTNRVLP